MLTLVVILISLFLIAAFLNVYLSKAAFLDIKSNVCLVNRTALVTGGSAGIGYQFVLKLAARGCRVIIADIVVNEGIKESIIKETHNSNIVLHYVDFSSFASVRKLADELKRTEEKIDILVNNAGIGLCTDKLTEDGLNLTMQVNYYSHFLITHLLIDLIKKSDYKRILFTSSLLCYSHLLYSGNVTSQEIKNLPYYLRLFDYSATKFLAVVAAKMFAKKLSKWNIMCNAYHPGAAKTAIWLNTEDIIKDLIKKSDHKRVVFTSSMLSYSHLLYSGNVTSKEIKNLPSCLRFMDYSTTKFLAVVAAKMFAKKLSKWNIICNAYHPGVAKTGIWQKAEEVVTSGFPKSIQSVDAVKACTTGVELAISDKFKNTTGQFYGLGFQIALKLSSRGCRVLIADKLVNPEIKNAIIDATGNPDVILHQVDFGSFKSVRELVKVLKKSESKLDILINNVGIGICSEKPTEDGLNLTMQVNYYSPFLLTHLLVDLLKKSHQGRVLFTASIASYLHILHQGSITSSTIRNPPSFFRVFDYPNSKFCDVVAAKMFARKLKRWNITSNVYHPGLANTSMWSTSQSQMHGIFGTITSYIALTPIHALFGIDADRACQAAVELSISKEFSYVSGIFFGKYFPNFVPRATDDEELCSKIWQATENIVKLKPEEKLQ
ncbi:unnamed protein product [Phyllotreta striolata]|uniref:Uncharacterized protein n=1 Tax=Phyllotreta striolata TaxID=444603 RepID=A0A9N9TDF5_PHYSR|nr:unnamed protein product [Phyllotreta striolata]